MIPHLFLYMFVSILQVCVNQERLQAFIRGARYLRIKGLEDNADDSDMEVNKSYFVSISLHLS